MILLHVGTRFYLSSSGIRSAPLPFESEGLSAGFPFYPTYLPTLPAHPRLRGNWLAIMMCPVKMSLLAYLHTLLWCERASVSSFLFDPPLPLPPLSTPARDLAPKCGEKGRVVGCGGEMIVVAAIIIKHTKIRSPPPPAGHSGCGLASWRVLYK